MSFWTRGNIKRVVSGAWLSKGREPETADQVEVAGLSTDSRAVKRGQAFLALRGERFDGHQFLRAAADAGVAMVIVDDEAAGQALVASFKPSEDVCVLRVSDTGRALLKLAAAYRKSLERTRVVGVVGSNGKTTTARLIASVLAGGKLRGTASPKSFNNAIGVPLTILSASSSDQYLVCEIGTNAPGEIAMLGEVVRPDVIVLTSIGREHLEGFGSVEGVAREEGAILAHAAEGALIVAPAALPRGAEGLEELLRVGLRNGGGGSGGANEGLTVVRFGCGGAGQPVADLRADDVRHEMGRLAFTINGRLAVSMPMLGEHNAMNALAAFAVGRRFGIDEAKIVAALGEAVGPPMRLEVVRVEVRASSGAGELTPITFVNDAYNANPDSTLASLATFESVMGDWAGVRRRLVVLGDMLELGDASEASHREIGRRVGTMPGVDQIMLAGPMMRFAAEEVTLLGRGGGLMHSAELTDAAIAALADRITPGDLVLLKGSRGTRLERVIQACRGELATVRKEPVAKVKNG